MDEVARTVRFGVVSWEFAADGRSIVVTKCVGPLGVPVSNFVLPVEIARSFANAVIATAKTIAPERKREPTHG